MISIPLVGDVQAAGLTPLHLADQLTIKLKKYVQDPNVSVVVTAIHSKLVYMIGEVGRTGPVEMTPDMTLLEAISSAGGLTEFANKNKIYNSPRRGREAPEDSGTLQGGAGGEPPV